MNDWTQLEKWRPRVECVIEDKYDFYFYFKFSRSMKNEIVVDQCHLCYQWLRSANSTEKSSTFAYKSNYSNELSIEDIIQ